MHCKTWMRAIFVVLMCCGVASVDALPPGGEGKETGRDRPPTREEMDTAERKAEQAGSNGKSREHDEHQSKTEELAANIFLGSDRKSAIERVVSALDNFRLSKKHLETLARLKDRLSLAVKDFLWLGFLYDQLPTVPERLRIPYVHGHPVHKEICTGDPPPSICLEEEALERMTCVIDGLHQHRWSSAQTRILSVAFEAAVLRLRETHKLDPSVRLPDWSCTTPAVVREFTFQEPWPWVRPPFYKSPRKVNYTGPYRVNEAERRRLRYSPYDAIGPRFPGPLLRPW